jgi:hypothetical protein
MFCKNQFKWNNSKTEKGIVGNLVHCTESHCKKHAYSGPFYLL